MCHLEEHGTLPQVQFSRRGWWLDPEGRCRRAYWQAYQSRGRRGGRGTGSNFATFFLVLFNVLFVLFCFVSFFTAALPYFTALAIVIKCVENIFLFCVFVKLRVYWFNRNYQYFSSAVHFHVNRFSRRR